MLNKNLSDPHLVQKMAEDNKSKNLPYDSLIAKTWITKGTRFTADQRLRAKHRWSNLSLAILSLYLIGLSSSEMLGVSIFDNDEFDKYIPMGVLFLSIFILIISMIENSKNHLLQAEKMHQCALEIQSIYHRLQLAIQNKKDTYELRETLLKEYDEILLKYPNHEERAFKVFKATNYNEANFNFWIITCSWLKMPIAKILLIYLWILDFWLYLLFILGPLIVLIFIIISKT